MSHAITILVTKKKQPTHSRLAASITDFWTMLLSDGNHPHDKTHTILHISNRKKAEVLCYFSQKSSADEIQCIGAAAYRKAYARLGSKEDADIRVLRGDDIRPSEKILAAKGILLASRADKKISIEESSQQIAIGGITDPSIRAVVDGIDYARYLTSLPANMLNPETYATMISDHFSSKNHCTVEIVSAEQLKQLGMNLFVAVGQGSKTPPRMIIIRYAHPDAPKKKLPSVLVGKGLTYDSGGLYAKPYPSMNEMHADMGGSATVLGVMEAATLLDAKISVVGVVGLAENMIDSNSMRNGDVYTAKNGKTVSIDHSDAEGRLVLADMLCYIDDMIPHSLIIDYATLTGACYAALGELYTGVFAIAESKDIDGLIAAGQRTNDKARRLPLDTECIDAMKAKHADLSNIGSFKGMLGASTAAGFLHNFVKNSVKWIHCDIAGTTMRTQMRKPYDNQNGIGTGAMVHATLGFLGVC